MMSFGGSSVDLKVQLRRLLGAGVRVALEHRLAVLESVLLAPEMSIV